MEHLILVTSSYPFGKGETFLETEIQILSKKFTKIIVVSTSQDFSITRSVPSNCEVINISDKLQVSKMSLFKHLFSLVFLRELNYILGNRKLKMIKCLKVAIVSIERATLIKNELLKYGKESTRYYSYWCDDSALSLSLLENMNVKISRAHRWDLYLHSNLDNYLPFRRQILSKLNMLYPISDSGITHIKESWRVKKSNIKVARLGTLKIPTRDDLSSNISRFKIISCSNLIVVKNVQMIIESLALLNSVPIQWIHFGDGPLKLELESLALSKLKMNFEFKGALSNTELLKWYQSNHVDLFINLSKSEGIPVSIMEAMSFGIPAIATDVGGTSEIVNNTNGYLVNVNFDPLDIAKIIEGYLSLSEEEILEKRKNAFNTWNDKYNAEKNYSEFAEELLNL